MHKTGFGVIGLYLASPLCSACFPLFFSDSAFTVSVALSFQFCVTLQNPVVTMAFLCGNLQLLAPGAGMANDTRAFCQPILRSIKLLIVCSVLTALAYVDIVVRSTPSFNPMHLYNYPQSFRLLFGAQCIGGIVFYCVVVISFRQAVDVYTHQRITSFWDWII